MGKRLALLLGLAAAFWLLFHLASPPLPAPLPAPPVPEDGARPEPPPADPSGIGPESAEDPVAETAGAEAADAAAPAPEEGLPITVELFDGETGDGVAGGALAWIRGEEEVPFAAHGARHELAAGPAKAGEELDLTLSLSPPSGWLPAEPGNVVSQTPVSAFARRLEVALPLYREAQLSVEVFEADGSPVEGASVVEVRFGGEKRGFEAVPTDAEGHARIRGLPSLRGERVVVVAQHGWRFAFSEPVPLPPSWRTATARVVLPKYGPAYRSGRRLRAMGGGGTSISVPAFPVGRGRLEIVVLRRDGSPAAGAAVRAEAFGMGDSWYSKTWALRADGAGRVGIAKLPDSTVTVSVREPGYLGPKQTRFEVTDGATTRGAIREEPGAASVVTVVDAEGVPLGGARIEVADRYGVPYVWLSGGVQRLAVFTDGDGRTVLPNLPAAGIRITATFGSRRTYGDVHGGEPLTLVLGGS